MRGPFSVARPGGLLRGPCPITPWGKRRCAALSVGSLRRSRFELPSPLFVASHVFPGFSLATSDLAPPLPNGTIAKSPVTARIRAVTLSRGAYQINCKSTERRRELPLRAVSAREQPLFLGANGNRLATTEKGGLRSDAHVIIASSSCLVPRRRSTHHRKH